MNLISQVIDLKYKLKINYATEYKIKLNKFYLLTDSNFHKNNYIISHIPNEPEFPILSESLFPKIRTIATLIAASRHDFNNQSPKVFTQEADWFAARIIILNIRFFFLNIKLYNVIKLANKRAKEFAKKYDLDFIPADIKFIINESINFIIFESQLSKVSVNNNADFLANSGLINSQLKNINI